MICRIVPLFTLVVCFMLWSAAGCNKETPAPTPVTPAPGPMPAPFQATDVAAAAQVPAQFAAARKTFDAHCQKCHTTQAGAPGAQGPGGNMGFPGGFGPDKGPPQDKKFGGGPGGFKGGMMKGPNLAKVGADLKHTRDWFIAYIRDPRSQKENARMPKFEGTIGNDELGALADYLGSLK